ncbi:hypothetical protein K501DRAFT_331343 [Backusella circina FSU 941]|nr:hypothetical protein K501DRAFT_331343 [Backusella circina FSU 941]
MEFAQTYCSHQEKQNDRQHLIDHHVKDILNSVLRPVFQQQAKEHPQLNSKKNVPSRYAKNDQLGLDFHENQKWKGEHFVDILCWLIEELEAQQIKDNLPLLLPPILIVLDDYDTTYKALAVTMVHTMISKLDASFIKGSGISQLFIESLFKCLNYVSEERDAALLQVAYKCIIDLIGLTNQPGSKGRSDLYERVLLDGVLLGFTYAGQKIAFMLILLPQIPILYNELGSVGVSYLKSIIPILCVSLAMTPGNNPKMEEMNRLAGEALGVVIKKCWPRIPNYEGEILRAIAKSWSHYYIIKEETMCNLLKQVYALFKAACQGKEENDKKALLEYNSQLFLPLFSG